MLSNVTFHVFSGILLLEGVRVMKKMKHYEILLLVLVPCLVYVYFGFQKSYLHMDEAYSLGLTHYDKIEIQDNEDFYDTWHDKEYYKKYLVLDKEEDNFRRVYENQRDDVHPPFYYLLLRIFQNFSKDVSFWPGIVLNLLIAILNILLLYFLLRELTKESDDSKLLSFVLTFLASIIFSSISSVIYIRMYSLATLFVLGLSFFHVKLLEHPESKFAYLGVFVCSLLGSLTHYYVLFYLFFLFCSFCYLYIKEKDWPHLRKYIFTIFASAVISLLFFPYSIKHLFFGYRGQGALENFLHPEIFLRQFGSYFLKLNQYTFHYTLFLLLLLFVVFWIKEKKEGKKFSFSTNSKILLFSVSGYFLLVSFLSPYIELRYIMPICSLVFVLFLLVLYQNATLLFDKKRVRVFAFVLLLFSLLLSFFFHNQPEVLYPHHKQIVEELKENNSIPAVYFLDSSNNRFLDDILLFSILEKSYVTLDVSFEEEKVKQIFEKLDSSQGVYLFLNQGEKNQIALDKMKTILQISNQEHRFHLNACDVYYLSF